MVQFSTLLEKDKRFNEIIKLYGHTEPVIREPGFETLCKIILEQQVSLQSAKAAFDKLALCVIDFTPDRLAICTEEDFKSCGVSRQKAKYIKGLAEAVVTGALDFDELHSKSHDEVRNELLRLKGVGNWTVDIYLMFSLQSPDILPLGDIAIISAIKDIWGFTTHEEIALHSKNWSPYRSSAAFLLWHYYLAKRGRKFPY